MQVKQQLERQKQQQQQQQQQQLQQQLALQLQLQQQQQQFQLLGEDWASTEADLSPYTTLATRPKVEQEQGGLQEEQDSFDSFCQLPADLECSPSHWSRPVKMELMDTNSSPSALEEPASTSSSILLDPPSSSSSCPSMYRCVDPQEVLGTVHPPATLKLPSFWSPWPRPSSPDWLQDGDLRQVPEQLGGLGEAEALGDIDYDKLL